MSGPYDDIIHLPHHVSTTQPRVPIANRAAQFAPFAALTGYNEALQESARLTEKRRELSEEMLTELGRKLCLLSDIMAEHPKVTVTYFQPDEKKEGGSYVTVTGEIKRIDEYNQMLILMNGEKIPINDIFEIESSLHLHQDNY